MPAKKEIARIANTNQQEATTISTLKIAPTDSNRAETIIRIAMLWEIILKGLRILKSLNIFNTEMSNVADTTMSTIAVTTIKKSS